MKRFITEIEVADESGTVEVIEVVTELPTAVTERAAAIYKAAKGTKSHDQCVAEALA